MKYVLGIDFGGGASKVTLLDETGVIVATSTAEYPTYYPKVGFVEQKAEDWYVAAKENINEILKISGINAADIAAISFDAATHTAVLMDEDFNVLCPSVYWTDIRSADIVKELKEKHGELIQKQAFHAPGTIWTLPQLMWLKQNKPEIIEKTKKLVFEKDYVRHMLTGDFCTDYIDAQGSMLFDMNTGKWSPELCEICGIDMEILPEIKKPKDIAGYVTESAAKDTGLAAGTPVLTGTTDTVMEVFAAGAVNEGNMTVKLATAGRICVVTEGPRPDPNLINYAHIVDKMWYPGTATKACASSLRWYRDTFGGDYAQLDVDAEQIPLGAGGLMYHPYLNGELTPYNDTNLCGSFVGIRGAHTKAHFTRALLEGVALSLLDCVKTLDGMDIYRDKKATLIGGGAKSKVWRQIVSDCLGIEFEGKECSDSSFGSAMLAGIAAGFWKDENDALAHCSKTSFTVTPDPEKTAEYEKIFKKYKAVHDALEGIYR